MDQEGYFTIEEFIDYLKKNMNIVITKRTLRYYASEGIFQPPAKRHGNKAYYHLDSIPKLQVLLRLKKYGTSIWEIRRILRETPEITVDALTKIELETFNKVIEAFTVGLAKHYLNENRIERDGLNDSLKDTLDEIFCADPRSELEESYFSFAKKIMGYLERYICIIPPSWFDAELEDIFLVKDLLKGKRGLEGSIIRYENKEKIRQIEKKVKEKVIKFFEEHISSLQNDLESLKKL